MSFASGDRPRNWYSMDYVEQREWEDNERKHRRALADAEYDRDRLASDHQNEMRRAESRKRELASERDEYAEEAGRLSLQLTELRTELEAIVVERDALLNHLKGMVGLVQIVQDREPTLLPNHRYVDAVALLSQLDPEAAS